MKKVTCFVFSLLTFFLFNALCLAAGPIELKAVQFLDMGNPGEKGYHLLIDTINKGGNGELTVKIVGGPEAIPARKQPEAVRLGAVDMAFVPCSWYASIVKEAAVMNLSRLEPWEERESGWHDYLVEKHKKAGLRFLGSNDIVGPFYMFAKEPIKGPQELKGKTFRHTPTYVFFKDFGMIPITTGHGEIYTGLERNLFVGFATKLPTVISMNLNEVCKYIIGPGFWPYSSSVALMNEKTFSSLPKRFQDLILASQKNSERKMMEEIREGLVKKIWGRLQSLGMKQVEWSPEDSKAFLDKINELTFKARTKRIPPEERAKIWKMLGY